MGMWNGKVQRLRPRATSVESSPYTVVVVSFFHRMDSADVVHFSNSRDR